MKNKTFKLVSLRLFTIMDIELKVEWINNPENNYYLHYNLPLDKKKTLEWFVNKDNATRIDCIIEYDNEPVGVIGLLNIDKTNLKAEYYITIGSVRHKRKGIAYIATMLIIEYAFEELMLNKVYLNVDADNEAACGLYERTGFKCEGLFYQDQRRGEHLINRKRYAVLKENWDNGWRKNE